MFRFGLKVWIGRTGGDLCPVAAVLSYNYGFASSGKGSTILLSEWQSSNEAKAGYQDAGDSSESGHRL